MNKHGDFLSLRATWEHLCLVSKMLGTNMKQKNHIHALLMRHLDNHGWKQKYLFSVNQTCSENGQPRGRQVTWRDKWPWGHCQSRDPENIQGIHFLGIRVQNYTWWCQIHAVHLCSVSIRAGQGGDGPVWKTALLISGIRVQWKEKVASDCWDSSQMGEVSALSVHISRLSFTLDSSTLFYLVQVCPVIHGFSYPWVPWTLGYLFKRFVGL